MATDAGTGHVAMYETLESASEDLGISVPSLSTASRDGHVCRGWTVRRVERLFAVRTRVRQDWVVCIVDSQGRYVEYGNPVRRLSPQEIEQVREITMGWHAAR